MNTDTLERPDTSIGHATYNPTTAPPPASPIQEVKDATTEQVKQVASDLKESGTEALHSAKEAGSDFVRDQKETIAAKIDSYTQAVKAACDSLRGGEGNLLVSPGERASRQLEKASEYLRTHDAMDLLHDLGDLARRKPEILFGGLFIVGLASVRFLKASSRDHRASQAANGASTYRSTPASPAIRPANINPSLLK